MSQSNYHRLANGTVFSYSTCIRQEVASLTIGNITRYSTTTSRHQSRAQCASCDVLLDDVPRDTVELLPLALRITAVCQTPDGKYRVRHPYSIVGSWSLKEYNHATA